MKTSLSKFVILSLIIVLSCSKEGIKDDSISLKPEFVTTLYPEDDNGYSYNVSNNVIQGIVSFENGWFVTQRSGNSVLLINYLNSNGQSLFKKRLFVNSHGQDLSLEVLSENELYLYTSQGAFEDNRGTGVLKLKVSLPISINGQRDWSSTTIEVFDQFDLNYTNATPTINEDKTQFAIRSASSVYLFSKESIENGSFSFHSYFQLNNKQLIDNGSNSMYFQGIAMKENNIYCLAGNEILGTNKNIFVYNQKGHVINQINFDRNDFVQNFDEKFEPEGLAFKDNDLYFTIMTYSTAYSGNKKYLYKVTL